MCEGYMIAVVVISFVAKISDMSRKATTDFA